MRKNFIIKAEDILWELDKLCLPYKNFKITDGMVFVRGTRLPIIKRYTLGDIPARNISNEPFHPIIGAYLIKEVLKSCHIGKKYNKLLDSNPMLKDSGTSFKVYGKSGNLEDVILDYLPELSQRLENINSKIQSSESGSKMLDGYRALEATTRDRLSMISELCMEVINMLDAYGIPNDRLVDIDVETEYIVVTPGESLPFLRIQEAGYWWKY